MIRKLFILTLLSIASAAWAEDPCYHLSISTEGAKPPADSICVHEFFKHYSNGKSECGADIELRKFVSFGAQDTVDNIKGMSWDCSTSEPLQRVYHAEQTIHLLEDALTIHFEKTDIGRREPDSGIVTIGKYHYNFEKEEVGQTWPDRR